VSTAGFGAAGGGGSGLLQPPTSMKSTTVSSDASLEISVGCFMPSQDGIVYQNDVQSFLTMGDLKFGKKSLVGAGEKI
jgi:hypothetical protein